MGVSLWLVPRNDFSVKLRELKYWGEDGPELEDGIIEFDPHITIIGFKKTATVEEVVMMLRAGRKASEVQKPPVDLVEKLWVEFDEMATDNHFYRAEVLRTVYDEQMKSLQDFFMDTLNFDVVKPTPETLGLQAKNGKKWKKWTEKYKADIQNEMGIRMFPHISIMYLGKKDLIKTQMEAKSKLEDNLRKEEDFFRNRCIVDKIMVVDCPDESLGKKDKDGKRQLTSWEAQRSRWVTIRLEDIGGLAEALAVSQ